MEEFENGGSDSYLEDESVNLKVGALAARKGLEVNAFRNRLIYRR